MGSAASWLVRRSGMGVSSVAGGGALTCALHGGGHRDGAGSAAIDYEDGLVGGPERKRLLDGRTTAQSAATAD